MNRVVHFEIPSDNPEKAKKFYSDVFGWSYQEFAGHEYWIAITGDSSEPGINGAIMKKKDPKQPLTNSINVESIDEAIKKIENSGGKIVVPKTPIPGVGSMAYFTDTDGNILGLWEDEKKE